MIAFRVFSAYHMEAGTVLLASACVVALFLFLGRSRGRDRSAEDGHGSPEPRRGTR